MRNGDANSSPVNRSPASSRQRTKMTAPVHNKAVPAIVGRFSLSGVACGVKGAGTGSVFGTSSPRTSSSSVTPKSSESFKSLSTSSSVFAGVQYSLQVSWTGSPLQIFCVQFIKRGSKSPPSEVEKLATNGCTPSKGCEIVVLCKIEKAKKPSYSPSKLRFRYDAKSYVCIF